MLPQGHPAGRQRGQGVTPGLAWSQSLDCSVACIWVVEGTGYKEPCPLDSPNSLDGPQGPQVPRLSLPEKIKMEPELGV